ncbi:MAG: NADH-quinone oxidoreductase subunit L [SAR202 cluster bacterium]|nr:NADH-quinone oxidoreductase subunit L [SAR202 cluster bacterium]
MGEALMLGEGTESSVITDVIFWVIAVGTIVAAIAVVQLRDLFRAALFLVVAFLGAAGMFVLLRAEFIAVVQVLIYVGAISVLIIFAIMTTREVEQGSPYNRLQVPALILAGLFLAGVIFVIFSTEWNVLDTAISGGRLADETATKASEVFAGTVPRIAGLLIREYVLAFEVASVVLLAAIIGALSLMRER